MPTPYARRQQLFRLWREQEGRCFYCERVTWLIGVEQHTGKKHLATLDPRAQATREHLIMQKHGGTNAPDNIVMACFECNSTRPDVPASEWLERKEHLAKRNLESPAPPPVLHYKLPTE